MSATHESCGVETLGIPGCEILRTLDEGGMGKVYLARQHTLNRFVCVKILSIPAGEDPERCRCRFNREAELLASVSHPHILSIFDFGTTTESGLPFLVTEYIEGGDLRRFMNLGKPMPVGQARSILLQVGEALTYLHSKGILHRDLKPENVLMPTSSLVKVGDLGIAVLLDEAGVLTKSSRGMGTVGYVSPEQQYGLKVDERTDQYSLAALAYELLTGRRPLGLFPPPSRLNRDLSRDTDPVILRGLSEEPRDRFPSVQDLLTALDRGLIGSSRRAPKLSLALIGLFAILALASAMAWISMSGSRPVVGIGQVTAQPNALTTRPVAIAAPARNGMGPGHSRQNAARPSREFTRLVELRAYTIWDRSGRPTGPAGEAVKERNWLEAEHQVRDEVAARAYRSWQEQGCPMGAAGEAVSEKNLRAAELELLAETEAGMRRRPTP